MLQRAAFHPRFRDAALIYNPQAGRARARREKNIHRAVRLLEAFGISCVLVPTTGSGSATELARREVDRSRDLVIACGGDGTVNEIVNGMVGSQTPLALLPAGTGNVLAKELELPWNIHLAAEYIPRGQVKRIALGRAGDRHFICMAGVGADASVVYKLSAAAKAALGLLSFWLEGFHHLFTYDFPRFQVEVNKWQFQAAQLIVSRTRNYGGPVRITRRASLLKDEFEVFLATSQIRYLYLGYFLAQQLGVLELLPGVHILTATEVKATKLHARAYIQVDGEPAGQLPVEIQIVPDALSVLVPDTFTG